MGNGASSDGRAAAGRPSSRPHSAAAGGPQRKQRVLANQGPRRSASSFRSPAAMQAAEASRQSAQRHPEAKSQALQRVAAQRRADANPAEEEALRAFTRNADPKSLRVLQLIQQADAVPQSNPAEKLRILRQCYPLLEEVPKDRFDQLAVTVYQQEGDIYYQQLDIQNAKDTFSRAITLAEKRVARQDTDMYMVLKRYVLAMIGMARIWYDHERDHQGFKFVDHKHPKVPAVDGAASDDGSASLSSLASSITSDGGSVFSLNEAILHSMAPRPPRRQTGPLFRRLKVKAPHTLPATANDREDEFVLHSRMTRELVASPCELLLLRCCEVVQIGHNAQSELLIPPQIELAQIYEDLGLFSRALLLVRRCLGILCSVYDYDHPWVIQLMQRADRLKELLEEQLRNEMATKIQATWKMHKAMQALEDALGRPVHRHYWIPRKYRATPDLDYLGDFVGDMPDDGLLGADDGQPEEESMPPTEDDPRSWAMVPQAVPVPAVSLSSDRPQRDPSYEAGEVEPALRNALVRYAPTQQQEGGDTFTAMVPNATVVGTTQDTQTDTDVQHTEFGDVLTVRTTTVTKTITEDLARSDEEEEEEEEESAEDEAAEDDEEYEDVEEVPPPVNTREAPPRPSPPQQQQQRQQPPPPPAHRPASLSDSPYADEEEEEEEEEVYPYDEDTAMEEPSPRDTSTEAQQPRHPRRHTAMPPPPLQAPSKPPQRAKQTQVQPRGHAAGTQTRDAPPPPPQQQQQNARLRDVSVSASSVEEPPSPPPPPPAHKTKQTQVQPRGLAAGTQTTHPSPPPPTPPARRASPVQPQVPPQPPRRTTTATQYETASDTSSLAPPPPPLPKPQQPRGAAARPPITSPYTDDDIPSLVVHERPAKQAPPSPPQQQQQQQPSRQVPSKPQKRSPPQPSPPHEEDDASMADSSVAEEPYKAASRAAAPPPPPPPRPYNPEVVHNSRREPFRDLVEPQEKYPLDVNGAPLFLPPLPYRSGLGPNGTPQPPASAAAPGSEQGGQLVVRVPSRSGAVQPYDPRKIDANAQPGMPMTLPSPANGYPRQMQNAPLPQPQPRKVTRDHKIITTRITRTYRRGGGDATESDDDGVAVEEDQIEEHESGSSWESGDSVSWEGSSNSSSTSHKHDHHRGKHHDAGSERSNADAASSSAASSSHRNVGLQSRRTAHHSSTSVRQPSKNSTAATGGVLRNISSQVNGGAKANGSRGQPTTADTFHGWREKEGAERDADGIKAEVVNASVKHHVKHQRRSKTTTTVRHH